VADGETLAGIKDMDIYFKDQQREGERENGKDTGQQPRLRTTTAKKPEQSYSHAYPRWHGI